MDDLQHFKKTYISECFELLADMEERLMRLDENADMEELNGIFRCAHSIKGGAGAFGLTQIAEFTHVLEALLDAMREGKLTATQEIVDTLLRARDVVMAMVSAADQETDLPSDYGSEELTQLQAFCAQVGSEAAAAVATASADAPAAKENNAAQTTYTIHFAPLAGMLAHGNEPLLLLRELASLGESSMEVDSEQLPELADLEPDVCYLRWKITLTSEESESRIREVFEFVEGECELKIEAAQPPSEEQPAPATSAPTETKPAAKPPADTPPTPAAPAVTSIRVDIDKVDRLINMVGEVVIIQGMLISQTRDMPDQEYPELQRGISELMQHTRELQEAVMAIRMQPVKSIFSRMPRIVRDLSNQLGKEIELEIFGELTEVDKTIIEQLSDPLTHMIRNSVDHGVEMPDVREKNGKPRTGTIRLSAEHRGGMIIIEISDDGAGINRERVYNKAVEKGVIAADTPLADHDIDQLIFAPGFSTAETVSNVSGRGVGMDVVKKNIEGLGGSVSIANTPGKGSLFTIALPLTLAILDGMIVGVAEEYYIVPINNIIETLRPKEEAVQTVADGTTVINVRGEFIPVLYLHRLFGIKNALREAHKALVVLVESGTQTLGLVVDELVGQQQVVIKSLEENTDRIPGLSGATILGDGKVSLILDVAALSQLAHPNEQLPHVAA